MSHYLNILTGDTSVEPAGRGWRVFNNFGTHRFNRRKRQVNRWFGQEPNSGLTEFVATQTMTLMPVIFELNEIRQEAQ
jgi:hypothetical protein